MKEELLPPPNKSWLDVLSELPEGKRLELVNSLKPEEAQTIENDWFFVGRREQLEPPGDYWYIWLYLAGRGSGKTASGSNWLIDKHRQGVAKSSCIIAPTANDLRNYCIEGPAGVLSWAPKDFKPRYLETKNKLEWPDGAVTILLTSEEPRRIRGGNFDFAWCDELAHWKAPEKCWSNLQFALRYGREVKAMITTTPQPIQIIKDFMEEEGRKVFVTRGSTYDNIKNLPEMYIDTVVKPYEGTSLGRQELHGELLMESEGALWTRKMLSDCQVSEVPELRRIVVGVDPAVSNSSNSDETGIIAAGVDKNGYAYVLGDHSVKGSPYKWAQKAVSVYDQLQANFIVAESNQGGDMVKQTIKNIDQSVPVKLVSASKGKVARAEPIASRYEQGRVFHCGRFPDLEDQLCLFVPGELKESPDRVDALVWALTELVGGSSKGRAGTWGRKIRETVST